MKTITIRPYIPGNNSTLESFWNYLSQFTDVTISKIQTGKVNNTFTATFEKQNFAQIKDYMSKFLCEYVR